ncbi:MAG TPA: PKD domain-containing protein [Chitinophagaceae bacterium]|nr:PKD domain-containing protein [Chitinophagaceae bacterium]
MHKYKLLIIAFFCCLYIFIGFTAKCQLCTGSLGDPVVNITFGSGANPGPPLSAATTNYTYVNSACPVNGFYTVLSSGIECNYGWHVLQHDHTGNPNGYFMLVDASFEPSDFYLDTVKNLCANTTYEFAAWILNMKNIQQGIRPNITFSIETPGGQVLKNYTTGDIPPEVAVNWRQYGFYFTTPSNVPVIVLRMTNNAQGGDGNDLALDDITFRPCGPLVNVLINGSDTVAVKNMCEGDTAAVNLSANVSQGYTAPEYRWQLSTDSGHSWNDIPGANTTAYRRLPAGRGRYLYRLTVAEAGNINLVTCRVASAPITIIVNSKPAVTAVNDGAKCAHQPITLTATGGVKYTWKGPGFTANGNPVTIHNGVNGAGYSVTATDGLGCSDTASTVITVFANPSSKYAVSSPLCERKDISFTDASTAAAGQTITKRAWDFGDGATGAGINPVHTFAAPGSYAVKLSVMDNKGCTDTAISQVTVHYLPQPGFILPKVCLTDPYAAFVDASVMGDGAGGASWLWHFGDANATTANPDTSVQQNPKHLYNAAGVYNVSLRVMSKYGCINDTVIPFTVNGALPKAAFTLGGNPLLCSNSKLVLTDNSSVNFGSIGIIRIYWDYANDTTNNTLDNSPLTGKNYTEAYPVFDMPATRDYHLRYIASSGISCINQVDTVLTIKASPLLKFNAISAVCSQDKPFTLTQAYEVNNMSGTGTYSGSGTGNGGLFTPVNAQVGIDTLQYTFTAANGCSAQVQQTITVYANPVVNAGPAITLLQGGSAVINAHASGNNLAYNWQPDAYIDNNTILTPIVNPVADMVYTLTATSANGCTATGNVTVTVLKTPVIPNAFSPNGDGINDKWMINYLDSYPGVTVQVFNRYGQLVFNSRGYSTPWDGTFNNKPLPVGIYYYVIDRKIAAPKLTGWVAIIR